MLHQPLPGILNHPSPPQQYTLKNNDLEEKTYLILKKTKKDARFLWGIVGKCVILNP